MDILRDLTSCTDSFEIPGEEPSVKRFRTRSPDSIKRELSGKRAERGKQRAKEKKLKQEQMRRARDEALEAEIYGTYPDQQADIAAAEAAAALLRKFLRFQICTVPPNSGLFRRIQPYTFNFRRR